MMMAQAPPDYKVTPINTSSGILYQHRGKAQLSTHEYTLLNYYNLSLVTQQISFIQHYYYDSLAICNLAISEHYTMECRNQLRYMDTKLSSIKSNFRIISHQLNISANRKRRGLMDGVGYAITWLFGNPNAKDAAYYSDSISSLVNNQKQTHVIMQEQVSVISQTIANFNESFTRMNENVNILNSNLRYFNILGEDIRDLTKKLELEVQLSNHMLLLIEMTDEIAQSLENYVNDVSLIQNGLINFRTLPPELLYVELQRLSTKFTLPIPLSVDNIYVYYKIMKLQSFVSNNILVVAFKLPLTNMYTYDLYEMFSLPIRHDNDHHLYSFIEPSQPFILIASTRTTFLTLNDLHECQEYIPASWLCKNSPPVKSMKQDHCEAELFMKSTTRIPKTCKVRSIVAELEIWHRLTATTWLFTISKPTQLTVICSHPHDSGVIETPLQHFAVLGILELHQNCKAYTTETVLETQSSLGILNLTHEIPSTDISQDDCCIRLKENITLNNVHFDPVKYANLNLQELKFAQHKLNQIDEQLQQQLNKPFIIQQSHWYTTALLLISGILCFLIIYNLAKRCGLTNCLSRIINRTQASTRSQNPCLRIYNQCFNKSQKTRPVRVEADTSVYSYQSYHMAEPECIEMQEDTEDEPPRTPSVRRSQRLQPKSKVTIAAQ